MKDIYAMLNQNLDDIPDSEPLTNKEVDKIMKKFRQEHQSPKIVRKSRPKTGIIFLAAAVMVAGIGTMTVTADRLGVFDRLTHKKDMTFELYEGVELPIDKHATPFNYEKLAEVAQDVTQPVTADSENFTIRTESVYCDGESLVIGISGSMKDGNPEHKKLIKMYPIRMVIDGHSYNNQLHNSAIARMDGSMVLDEGTENEFSGEISVIFAQGFEITEPQTIEVKAIQTMAQENYVDENAIDLGEIVFNVDIVPDASFREQTPYTITEDGYSVRFYEITPAMMVVGFYEEGKDQMDVHAWLDDADGNQLEPMGLGALPDYGDGYGIGCMTPMTSGELTAVFFEKVSSYEDGRQHTKDITINMDEVYTALTGESDSPAE